MTAVQFLVLSACAFSLASSSAIEVSHKQQLQDFQAHATELSDYPCHLPQARVYRMEELLKKEDLEHKAFYPEMTVLHSCGHSGCCTSGLSCVAKDETFVARAFKVTFLANVGKHKIGSWATEYYQFLSPKECHCVDLHQGAPEYHQAQDFHDSDYSLVNRFGEALSPDQKEESASGGNSSSTEGPDLVFATSAPADNAV